MNKKLESYFNKYLFTIDLPFISISIHRRTKAKGFSKMDIQQFKSLSGSCNIPFDMSEMLLNIRHEE